MRFKQRAIGRHELSQAPNNGAYLWDRVYAESPPDVPYATFLTPEEVLILLQELEKLKPVVEQAVIEEALHVAKRPVTNAIRASRGAK